MQELRDELGYVPQKGVLFSGTIESNIKFGVDDASMDTVKEAADIAQASEFIEEKSGKYEAPIAQGGTNVSGGQKQRLSIARAIAKNPKIFIFDDSFSALDLKTDAALRKALASKVTDSTVIIVAQRISTILHAEQILVMDEGKIVGKGTHEELMKNCEVYQQIAKSQLSAKELEASVSSQSLDTFNSAEGNEETADEFIEKTDIVYLMERISIIMADNNSYKQPPRRRGPGGPGRGMMPAEKAKDFKGSIGKLIKYIGTYKIAIIFVMVMAAASTVFSVIGPKILGKATTGLSEGLMRKIAGTGGIDFGYIGKILLIVLGLYACSAIFNFIQGWIMTGISQKICYRMRKEISEKINRMPMKYFESRTYGEVLSRITNDVDTLGMGLNQSITTIITATATMIGVLIMMLSISPLMTIIAIVILPISVALVSFVIKKSQNYFKTQQEYLGHINGQVEETYGGHLVVKSFNKEKDMVDEFNKTNNILYSSA